MKKMALLMFVLLVFGLLGCGEKESTKGNPGELVVGKNAFGVKAYVRNMTSEYVTFIVVPYGGEFVGTDKGEVDGPGGVFGSVGLVQGHKRGNKVELDGSFTIYAHNLSGPSVVIQVKGMYVINELKNNFATMHFYLYKDGEFSKSDKATVYK
ncbi:MAG: hypothetical protein KGZ50_02590 [Peptococcaceae bacterium]|nr:hypothetical protein [Peptococcaceae bacterium]